MNRKGFTLIELVAVIILLGIILVIAIPNLTKIVGKQSDTEYKMQLSMIKNALDLYTIRHHGVLVSVNSSCIMLDYSSLKDEGLIEENSVKCTGKIILTPKKNNSYSYQYFLNCFDKNDREMSSYETSDIPVGCYNMNS